MRARMGLVVMTLVGCMGSGPAEESGGAGQATTGGGSTSSGTGVVTRELYTSGSRLKVLSLAGSDGSRQQAGLVDTQLESPCTFLKTTAGYHCLPYANTAWGNAEAGCLVTASAYFADAACTEATCIVTTPGVVGRYALNVSSAAGATSHLVGNPVTGTVYTLSAGTCSTTTSVATFRHFRVGPALPLSDFVGGTVEVEP